MSKEERAERLKEAIVRRKLERDAEPEIDGGVPEEEVDFEDLLAPVETFEIEDDEGELDPVAFEAQLALVQEAGFDAYLEGKSFEDNPFYAEEVIEDLQEEEAEILGDGWEAGWFEAHREAWTAELILASKHLVECEDPDEAAALVNRMEQAVEILETMMDFEAYEDFWGFKNTQ